MKIISFVFFLWIIFNVVSGKEQRSLKDNGLKNVGTLDGKDAESESDVLTKTLRSRYQRKILEDLRRLYSEKENVNNHDNDGGADDRKRQETLEGLRAILGLKLTKWLNKDDTRNRGWGNGELPGKK